MTGAKSWWPEGARAAGGPGGAAGGWRGSRRVPGPGGWPGHPVKWPGKCWCRCGRLNAWTVALCTCPHHLPLPGVEEGRKGIPADPAVSGHPAGLSLPESGPLLRPPEPLLCRSWACACRGRCCREAGPVHQFGAQMRALGAPGCFSAQLWLFLHAPWAPSCELKPQRPMLSCFCLKGLFSCGPDGAPSVLNSGVLACWAGHLGPQVRGPIVCGHSLAGAELRPPASSPAGSS